jgi:hypothetical protein
MEFLHLSILRHNIAVEGSSTMMVDISAGIPASFLTTMMVDITAGISASFLTTMMVDITAGIPASFLTTMMVDITAGISPSFLPHNDALCIRITNFWIAS